MDQVIEGAAGADCGVLMLRNICRNFYWCSPNKFFEYMLAELPVAVSNFPDLAAHVSRERCGVVFDPDSPESIAAALRSLAENIEEARAMGHRGRQSVLREHNWEAAAKALLEQYNRI
jgi:glycosyltransferase involved in cell wall biosynthesis